MALDYIILGNKKNISMQSTFDGSLKTDCIDLLSQTLSIDEPMGRYNVVTVEKEYIARPDLISLAVYNTDQYADVICKVNGISNPFELNEGMLLLVPEPSYLNRVFNVSPKENEFIKNDSDSILQGKKSNKKYLNQKRSPIESTILDDNYKTYEDLKGLIFY